MASDHGSDEANGYGYAGDQPRLQPAHTGCVVEAAQHAGLDHPETHSAHQLQTLPGRSNSNRLSNSSDLTQNPLYVASQSAQTLLDYTMTPTSGSSDSLNIYGTQDMPSLRGGDGATAISNGWWIDPPPSMVQMSSTVMGRSSDNDLAAAGSIDPSRACFLATGPSDDDPDRDLYEAPPPVTQPLRQTGANSAPLGTRRQLQSSQGRLSNQRQEPFMIDLTSMSPPRTSAALNPGRGRHDVRSARREWDFNGDQPVPWKMPCQPRSLQVREFSKCKDASLLNYLAARNVSAGFLVEIDQFIRGNPEIGKCSAGVSFLELLTSLSPLDAYQYFLKGYTRPARYIDGIIIASDFRLPAGFRPPLIGSIRDKELDDFFDGFEYRYDILERIDREVAIACAKISYGRSIPSGLRRLVCYAVWGNPVDAYKWYEYNYQSEFMPHRYLPEHVILGDIPKPDDYVEPEPSCVKGWKRHREVRFRMARAKDEGVDVIDVLMTEYREALVRKGYRRVEIDSLCSTTQRRLDDERAHPRGVDIVDMVMDDAIGRNRPPAFHSAAARSTPRPSARTHVLLLLRGMRGAKRRNAPNVIQAQSTQARELREVKILLERLYTQEMHAMATGGHNQMPSAISNSRATTERRYVNCLIRYLRDAKRMDSLTAADLQRRFTRQRMARMREGSSRDYLFSMYPQELR